MSQQNVRGSSSYLPATQHSSSVCLTLISPTCRWDNKVRLQDCINPINTVAGICFFPPNHALVMDKYFIWLFPLKTSFSLLKPKHSLLYFSKDRNWHSNQQSYKILLQICMFLNLVPCCMLLMEIAKHQKYQISSVHQNSKPGMPNDWHPMITSVIKICFNAACFMWIRPLHQIAACGMWFRLGPGF